MRTLPLPFADIPPETKRLTTLQCLTPMRMLLQHVHSVANTASTAATPPDGPPDTLSDALFMLEQYAECALRLFERWVQDVHPGPRIQEAAKTPRGDIA